MPSPTADPVSARTRRGRLLMFLLLLVCAAPVVASYLAFYVIHPQGRTNYGALISPPRPIPADLGLTALDGAPVASASLKGQWLLLVVSGGACTDRCEHYLWIQRQLREALGAERDRVDKIWLIDDAADPSRATLGAVEIPGAPALVLRAAQSKLRSWLVPAEGHRMEDHLYVVDPRGDWMMRMPVDPDPARVKRDISRLLRASSSWDRAGR